MRTFKSSDDKLMYGYNPMHVLTTNHGQHKPVSFRRFLDMETKEPLLIDTPERPAGQKSVLGLTHPKMEVVHVGFVGLGMRGPGAVERFTYIPGTQIVALCDYEASRAEKCQDILKKASMPKAAIYSGEKGYEELCKRTDIDLVYIAADWLHHFPVAKCALENGKNVAIEVPWP